MSPANNDYIHTRPALRRSRRGSEANLTSNHEDSGLTPGLAPWVKGPRCVVVEVTVEAQIPWRKPAAAVPIQPRAWEPPRAAGLGIGWVCTEGQEVTRHLPPLLASTCPVTSSLTTCSDESKPQLEKRVLEFPLWFSRLRTRLVSRTNRVPSLALVSGLGIWCCRELWCSLQTRLRSGVAVAQAGGFGSDPTPSLGTSIRFGCGTKHKRKKKSAEAPLTPTGPAHRRLEAPSLGPATSSVLGKQRAPEPWLWCRPAAVAPIRPLAWESPYAVGTTLKDKKKQTNTDHGLITVEAG